MYHSDDRYSGGGKMRLHYPIGTQYHASIGKGSLAGMADEILDIAKNYKAAMEREALARKARTVEMRDYNRDYNREGRARPVKRMTAAMLDIIAYVKRNPGTKRCDLLNVHLGGKCNVSTSSLGDNLAALVRQGYLTNNGLTQNRRYYVTGVEYDNKIQAQNCVAR
ncbi:hypothetical protein UFOVP939_39 [uncultured Caudovirales phage]|uniref:Uncharacterized protein n=1 Tax=uncultured Caudovirales phage TaxID=2100421 RepID=A0A6J5PU17_9CAUD|nr:hypothetical protein UFOVP939_39 [uncultured Caudovirales phage]